MVDITNLLKEYEESVKNFRTKLQDGLKEAFSQFFQNTPEVKAIVWDQYTPYFNDGE